MVLLPGDTAADRTLLPNEQKGGTCGCLVLTLDTEHVSTDISNEVNRTNVEPGCRQCQKEGRLTLLLLKNKVALVTHTC